VQLILNAARIAYRVAIVTASMHVRRFSAAERLEKIKRVTAALQSSRIAARVVSAKSLSPDYAAPAGGCGINH
jgi:hypothetical protein